MSHVASEAAAVSEVVEAVAHAPETISKIFELGGRLAYGTGYTAAYVIVFPAALIYAAIPKGNALVHGLIDGSAAAGNKARSWIR
jgi:N-acetylmuramic acid 6-phosphate (MurNAc-6-P) etherase